MTYWTVEPILDSLPLVIVITISLAVLLWFGPTFRNISRTRKRRLTLLRAGSLLLMLLAMLRPTCVTTVSLPQKPILAIMADVSRSMKLPAASGQRSRWVAQSEVWGKSEAALDKLAKRLDIRLYGYDGKLQPLKLTNGKIEFPEEPTGRFTDIPSNIQEVIQRDLGQPFAGIIVTGDGTQTAIDPKIDVQEAGRELNRIDCPLFAIGFGLQSSAGQARDVAIDNLPEQYTVFVKNRMIIRASVRVRSYTNKAIPVELVVENSVTGKQEIVDRQTVTATEDGQQKTVRMNYLPPKTGRFKLIVRAPVQPGEIVTKNNQLTAFLTVLEGGLRILYLEGQPRIERNFIRRSLDQSPDMQLDDQWIEERLRKSWPINVGDTLKSNEFDIVILGDLDSTALGDANLNDLAKAVENGKGLMMIGGYHSFGPGGYGTTPLAKVLPITIRGTERQDFGTSIRKDMHLSGEQRMVPVGRHSITRLGPDDQNAAIWSRLPTLKGANRFYSVKEGTGIQVIAESQAAKPILVTGEYGKGRVLAFAGDSTWRWRLRGFKSQHNRFWRQAILWLVHRDQLNNDEVWVKLEQRRFLPGSRVLFTTGARTGSGDALPEAKLSAELVRPDGKAVKVPLVQDGVTFKGIVQQINEAGNYTLRVSARHNNQPLGRAVAEFQVIDQDFELANPSADFQMLSRLATLTKQHKGELLAPEQLPTLLQRLYDEPPDVKVEQQSKWRLGDTTLDAWTFCILMVTLLGFEWYLRKKWGLV